MKRFLSILSLVAVMAFSCNKGGEEEDTPITPGAPQNLKVHSKTTTSLTFQWGLVDGAVSYKWRLLKGDSILVDEGIVNPRNVIIQGLEPGTSYTFYVSSVGADGSTSKETSISDSTESDGTPPVNPTGKYEDFLIPAAEEDGVARAFPGAEGGGMWTTGGRGGEVIHVTTLEDNKSKGSLRWAVNQTGARTIVFDVAGVITLNDDLKITNGNITIAGQTAPGDGICIKNYTVNIDADNVIIRFMRFRLGDQAPWTDAQIQAGKADGEDCIWGRQHRNIILDHCSMSWSVDECASFYDNEYFTLQWSILAESMKNCKLHSKGNHGYGGIWGGKNASFHHNILAHHDSRNARIDHPHIYDGSDHRNPVRRGNVDYRNNVIYNWGSNNTYGGEAGWFNVVNNYYKPGPSSSDRKYILDLNAIYTSNCSTCGGKNVDYGYAKVFVEGNIHTKYTSLSNAQLIKWHDGSGHDNYNSPLSSPLELVGPDSRPVYVSTHSAENAKNAACAWGGASLVRDAVDARVASDVKNSTGKIIGDIAAVIESYGYAWPEYTYNPDDENLRDSDSDGMPNWFEDMFGLNKSSASDASQKTLDKYGRYTNLEMYLHYIVRNIVAEQNANAQYTTHTNQ